MSDSIGELTKALAAAQVEAATAIAKIKEAA